ncbi:glycosyltransferase family 25 protein [Gemmata palustris]|uniref:glycosyltransferase family 25 protein n=1 Tax=Gemmata palustris TaxID=2822762 RepID=UPI0021BCBD8F|nr:glycosyltransferase family 25 protein [Gemmata palustris]
MHYLINLRKRPDRLAESLEECRRVGIQPIVWEATDGTTVPMPPDFKENAGALGCRLSHMSVLADVIAKGYEQVCVLEDDVTFVPNFQERLSAFLEEVPPDWQALMLGGQHASAPEQVSPGVVRCLSCHRTHAYMVRGEFINQLHSIFARSRGHVDWEWAHAQKDYRVYAPTAWLAGQRASKSDITNFDTHSTRWWQNRRPAVGRKAR